jgi:hypothetical protein
MTLLMGRERLTFINALGQISGWRRFQC